MVFFLETVDSQWLPLITAAETPDKIWKAVQDKPARENPVSFYSRFASLLNLRATSKTGLSATITKFDTEWTRLTRRCSVAKETDKFILPWAFQRVFLTTQCKAAFLLHTLPPSMHIKDNLMTKDNLTYEQYYQHLMDITTEAERDDKAYAVTLARHR